MKTLQRLAVAVLLMSASSRVADIQGAERQDSSIRTNPRAARAEGLAAWDQVYSVLSHPRCINCHTAVNYPQQGDDRHRHLFNVVRGREGQGVAGVNCATCHQNSNADSTGVPGAHNWQLAPLSMRWQDQNDRNLPSSAVCKVVTDQSRNHHLDGPGLLKHHEDEFGTAVACAAEVSVANRRPRIHRVTVTLNCGLAVNPLTIESQFQGGLGFGVTQLMAGGAITLKDGRVAQRNFDGYTPPYMKDAPEAVDVHIVPSGDPPTGCGEPPVPVIAPAVANALFKLTGKRYRTLPLAAISPETRS